MRTLTDEEHCEALDALYATLPEKYTRLEFCQWSDEAILRAQVHVTLKDVGEWLDKASTRDERGVFCGVGISERDIEALREGRLPE